LKKLNTERPPPIRVEFSISFQDNCVRRKQAVTKSVATACLRRLKLVWKLIETTQSGAAAAYPF
jgi:hypothetical protein